jgi:hypothetical protein
MKSKIAANLFLTIMAGFLATGCASVHDFSSKLAPDARATLKGSVPVCLQVVDGNWLTGSGNSPISGSDNYIIYLAPGTHTLTFQCYFEPWQLLIADSLPGQGAQTHYLVSGTSDLKFEAVAGHTYSLVGERIKNRWKVSIKDSGAGQAPTILSNFAEGGLGMQAVPTR